jgi:O-antigen/teichoic acid export membrane protein
MNIYVTSGVLFAVFTAGFAFVLIPKYGITGFLCTQIVATTCAFLYTLIFGKLWKYLSLRSVDKVHFREMLNYSLPLVPNVIMAWLINGTNRFFLEHFHGLDTNGIFAAALKFPMLFGTFFHVFFISWQISAIEEYKSDKYNDFYNKIFSLVFLGLTGGMLAIALSSDLLTTIFVDAKFSDARLYIPILTVAPFISCLAVFVGVNFMATKKTKYAFTTTLYGGLTCIAGNIILVPSLGIMGAAYSQILSFAVMLVTRIYYTRKMAKINNLLSYLCSFVSLLLIVLLFNSGITAKFPIIALLILLILFFN